MRTKGALKVTVGLLLVGVVIQACSDTTKSSDDEGGTGGLGGAAGHGPGGMAGEGSGGRGNGSGTGGSHTGGASHGTGGTLNTSGGSAGAAGSAGEGGTGPGECEIGEAQNPAAPGSLDLFGEVSYYADGAVLPAGRYRVSFVDGCFKYSGSQDWTIHAYDNQDYGWYLGAASQDRLVRLPGTVGYAASNGAFADFEDCVEANQALAPVEFDFVGGVLGIWLADSNFPDNVAGVDGRNPTWKLTRLDVDGCE